MTPEQLEAHRVQFEQKYAACSGTLTYAVKSAREGTGYASELVGLQDAWEGYQWAIADAAQPPQQSAQPVADSDLEKLATDLKLYSDYEKGRSQADFLDPVLFGRATIALYAASQPVEHLGKERVGWLYRGIASHTDGKLILHKERETRLETRWWEELGQVYLETPSSPQPVEVQQVALIDALQELMAWQVKNVHCWNNSAYDNAAKVLRDCGIQPKGEKQ